LELGVDVSRFDKDQQKALAKIQQFESQTKRAAGNARGGIKTVGDAFRDLAKDSRIGSSATQVENLASKFKMLGQSMQISGGVGTPFGAMAQGLGMLLSPAALGIAAVGILAKETWNFNESMTASNATLARNSELASMSTKNLWAMGMAAKTVGGSPEAVEASIANLQTSLAGMSIGVGSAVPQLIGMARLRHYGARFNPGGFGKGADEESLFKAVYAMYQSQGRAKTMALVTGYGLMGQDQANLAMSPNGWAEYQKSQKQAQAMTTGGGFENVIRESLKSQVGIGEKDISEAIAAETAYGGIQQPMQTIVGMLTKISATITAIFNFLTGKKIGEAYDATVDAASRGIDWAVSGVKNFFGRSSETTNKAMAIAMKTLMGKGASENDAAAMVGNMMQESAMDPLARNASGHVGLGQWDKARQADFAKRYGYQMGSGAVPADKQSTDQTLFFLDEFQTTQRQAASAMAKARSLFGKTSAFMNLDERPGDNSLSQRYSYAQQAMQLADAANARANNVQHNDNRSDTKIGNINVHTAATDAAGLAAALRKALSAQPLLNHAAQGTVALATRANN
jgi:hypothetical protein